jgi:hypothetical protein
VVYEAGIRSTWEFTNTELTTILTRCQTVIEKHGYAAGKLGEEDISYGINYAKVIVACDNKSEKK